MRGIDSGSKSLEVFNLLKNTLELFPVISDARKWSNPSGFQHESRVYELKNDNGCIWATLEPGHPLHQMRLTGMVY